MSLVLIMSITACGKRTEETEASTTAMQATQETENSTQAADEKESLYKSALAINQNEEDCGEITVQKYRSIFYNVPISFVNLVGQEVYLEWRDNTESPHTSEKMRMAQFVQHFGITREQFDRANLEWAKIIKDNFDCAPCMNPKDYANQIIAEVYNADIIYTFDDDIIREYYLSPEYPYIYEIEYEEAVEKGEYQSQTEVWVNVEQMEAEINAKYGVQETTAVIETTAE